MQYIVGLTGLIGSGKSLAGKIFKELGITVIDTDAISHQITAKDGAAIPRIIKEFGSDFINQTGELNRLKMRELVFAKPEQRRSLEKILHPLIFAEVLNQAGVSTSIYTIVMVPLLFKSIKYLNIIHRSVFVDCEEDTLISRVIERSQMKASDIKAVLKVQMHRQLQLVLSDDVLYNNGTILELSDQIAKLDKKYQKLFAGVQEKV